MHTTLTAAQWADIQHDVELGWIVQETLAAAIPVKNSFRNVYEALADAVAMTLCEREPTLQGKLLARDLYPIAFGYQVQRDEVWKKAPRFQQIQDIMPLWLAYAHLLMMGMPPHTQLRNAWDTDWPFGQEGGFCNPMKLQLMRDDA